MLNYADGTLSKQDIDRLLSYGISKKTARAVKKLYDDGVMAVLKMAMLHIYLMHGDGQKQVQVDLHYKSF